MLRIEFLCFITKKKDGSCWTGLAINGRCVSGAVVAVTAGGSTAELRECELCSLMALALWTQAGMWEV